MINTEKSVCKQKETQRWDNYQIQEFEFLFTIDREYFKVLVKATYRKLKWEY